MARRSEFRFACCALCAKADIPQVQAVIRLLDPFVQRELRAIAQDVFRELLTRLDALSDDLGAADVDALVLAGEDRDDVLAALLAGLLLVIEQGYGAIVSGEFRERVEDGVDALFAFAASDVGFTLAGPQAELLRQAAVQQLDIMLRDAVLNKQVELRGLLETFLTTAPAREAAAGALAGAAGDSGLTRDQFEQELASTLAPAAAATASLDAWAYLWSNVAAVEAAYQGGIRAFEAVAFRDSGTTKFCRWVDRRIIPLSRIRPQIAALTRNSLFGRGEALRAAWPFLDSNTARNGNELQFELFFRKAGLSPYHFGCRTRCRPVRIER